MFIKISGKKTRLVNNVIQVLLCTACYSKLMYLIICVVHTSFETEQLNM